MPWIRTVNEDEAEKAVDDVYRRIRGSRGKVSEIMRIQSLRPDAMAAHLDLYLAVMFAPGGVARAEREMIAVAVSVWNGCDYCVRHHAEALRACWPDEDAVEALIRDPESAATDPRRAAILAYARALTAAPAESDERLVTDLRTAGLSDEEILEVNLVTSYFNFVNRIAAGLGVEATADDLSGYTY